MLPANHLLSAHKGRISGSQVKGVRAHKKKKSFKKALKVRLLAGGVAAPWRSASCVNALFVRRARTGQTHL